MNNNPESNRRPLASRQTEWAHRITRALASTSITPNQISIGSMIFAAFAGLAFFGAAFFTGGLCSLLLVAAALFCQMRLLCNLFDGMVAVEAGKQSADGVAWNEFPDRFADIFILTGIGYAISQPALGWAAATFAVLTAYTRELSAANDQGHDFSGPMAKQHRMAVVTFAAILAAVAASITSIGQFLSFQLILGSALGLVAAGSLLTALRRIYHLLGKLN